MKGKYKGFEIEAKRAKGSELYGDVIEYSIFRIADGCEMVSGVDYENTSITIWGFYDYLKEVVDGFLAEQEESCISTTTANG